MKIQCHQPVYVNEMLDYGFELDFQMEMIPLHSRILFVLLSNDASDLINFNHFIFSQPVNNSTDDKQSNFPIKSTNESN